MNRAQGESCSTSAVIRLCCLAALFAVSISALAQAGPAVHKPPAAETRPPSLSLSPAVVMTKGNFGQSITQTLLLNNDTPMELQFDMVAEDVRIENGKRVFVTAGELPGSIAATAVFSSKTVSAKPFSTASVDVRFTMPAGSPLRAVVALFRGTNKVPSGQNGVAMTASLGTLITFTMSDKFELSPEPIRFGNQTATSNVTISQWLTNTGAEPVVPEGVVAILNQSGVLVTKAPIAAQRLLPGEHLEFKAEAPLPLEPGKYHVLASYKYEGQTVTQAGDLILQ